MRTITAGRGPLMVTREGLPISGVVSESEAPSSTGSEASVPHEGGTAAQRLRRARCAVRGSVALASR